MKSAKAQQIGNALINHAGRWSEAQARVLCYLLGPLSSALILFSRRGHLWSVRFHAVHSMLLTVTAAMAWGTLRLGEEISPWFLSTVLRELRFAMILGFLFLWICLLVAAYRGVRCAVVPYLHGLSVRLARRSEKHMHLDTASARA